MGSKKTMVPVFALAFGIGGYWWYLRSFRQDLNLMFNESGLESIDLLTQPTTEESALLIAATALFLYGLYKIILYLKADKEIDESAAIDTFIKTHDRKFGLKTNIIIWLLLLVAFAVVVLYALFISRGI